MPKHFEGKVAVITGAAMGFGRAFAEAFSRKGAAVAIADIDLESATRTATEIAEGGRNVMAVRCDVGDEQSVRETIDKVVGRLGGVDILINNAALHLKKYNQPFSVLTSEEIRNLFDVNVLGIVYCSLACRPSMCERRNGVIVNMASVGGYMSNSPYSVTKVAVRGLTVAFASEFGADGIRVNAIAPTMTPTDGLRLEYSDEEIDRSVQTRQFLQRRSTVDDITRTMLFLCSEDAAFITGETIRVSGGASMSI